MMFEYFKLASSVGLKKSAEADRLGAVHLDYSLLSLSDRNLVTVVLHTGQAPLTIGRPLAVFTTLPTLIVCFLRHLTQYPTNSILNLLSRLELALLKIE
jgi:hypothetical protein